MYYLVPSGKLLLISFSFHTASTFIKQTMIFFNIPDKIDFVYIKSKINNQ